MGRPRKKKVDPATLVDQAEQDFETCPKCKAAIFNGICNCKQADDVKKAEELAKAMEGASQTKEVPPPPAGEQPQGPPVFSAREALQRLPNAPSEAQIEAWKGQFGAVYTFPFDPKEIYLWRPLRRREWQMLQSNEALVQDEAKFQEQVVLKAILWPNLGPVELNLTRAGLVQTLFSVIMQGSYFLHPDFALTLVEEL
jgi:hypothetical protein